MLIHENGQTFGAVSGGCVEKEIVLQANSVFKTDIPKMITYDGDLNWVVRGLFTSLLNL